MLSFLFGPPLVQRLRTHGRLGAARERVEAALAREPGDPHLLALYAELCLQAGDALTALRVWLDLAAMYAERGFGGRALQLLDQARRVDPRADVPGWCDDRLRVVAALDGLAALPWAEPRGRAMLLYCLSHRPLLVAQAGAQVGGLLHARQTVLVVSGRLCWSGPPATLVVDTDAQGPARVGPWSGQQRVYAETRVLGVWLDPIDDAVWMGENEAPASCAPLAHRESA